MTYLLVALLGTVPALEDLQALGCASGERVPIVVYVSRSDCTYCLRMERDVLKPLVRSGWLEGRAHVRELVLDGSAPIRDFAGAEIAPEDLAARYQARVTPTLLFLDPQGRELVKRLVGYTGSDFYSYYLERAIVRSARDLPDSSCAPR